MQRKKRKKEMLIIYNYICKSKIKFSLKKFLVKNTSLALWLLIPKSVIAIINNRRMRVVEIDDGINKLSWPRHPKDFTNFRAKI